MHRKVHPRRPNIDRALTRSMFVKGKEEENKGLHTAVVQGRRIDSARAIDEISPDPIHRGGNGGVGGAVHGGPRQDGRRFKKPSQKGRGRVKEKRERPDAKTGRGDRPGRGAAAKDRREGRRGEDASDGRNKSRETTTRMQSERQRTTKGSWFGLGGGRKRISGKASNREVRRAGRGRR